MGASAMVLATVRIFLRHGQASDQVSRAGSAPTDPFRPAPDHEGPAEVLEHCSDSQAAAACVSCVVDQP